LAFLTLETIEEGKTNLRIRKSDDFTIYYDDYLYLVRSGIWYDIQQIMHTDFVQDNQKYIDLSWTIMEWDDASRLTQSVDAANEMVNSVLKDGMSNEEKYLALNNAIVDAVVYGSYEESEDEGQSAYSALVSHNTVCAGYARAYKLLCDIAGLPCVYATGRADAGSGVETHAWNMVPSKGEWVYIDTTWNDTRNNNELFLKSDKFMSKDHSRYVDYLPIATFLYPSRDDVGDELARRDLFAGTQQGYMLEKRARRVEAAVILARVLGLNNLYTNSTDFPLPFSDVPGWAREDVAVLYKYHFTAGVNPTLFGSEQSANLQMVATNVSIALRYIVDVDFTYADSKAFAVSLGLLSQGEVEAIEYRGFVRGDLVLLTYRALNTHINGSELSLALVLEV
jgi:hypothetical protein